jgi:hypothetical protein
MLKSAVYTYKVPKSLCERCNENHGKYRVLIMRNKLTAIALCKKCFDEWIELKAKRFPRGSLKGIYSETPVFEKFLKQKKVKVILI